MTRSSLRSWVRHTRTVLSRPIDTTRMKSGVALICLMDALCIAYVTRGWGSDVWAYAKPSDSNPAVSIKPFAARMHHAMTGLSAPLFIVAHCAAGSKS